MDDDQHKLIERCRAGDRVAFDMLLHPLYPGVWRTIAMMMSNPDDTADVMQEVLLKTWSNIDQYSGKGGFTAWVYAIAVNTCIKRRKQRTSFWRRHPEAPEEIWDTFVVEDAAAEPLDSALGKERVEVIDHALARLSPKHRAAIVLREVEGLSYEDMAAALNINIGTVMSRLHNARKQLKELIEKDLA